MKQEQLKVLSNKKIAENIYEMQLQGDMSAITNAGQFVNLLIDGCYLRRPISVCNVEGDILTLVYKVVGKGTEIMKGIKRGKKIDTLTGLGNGYNLNAETKKPLLLGGGVGVPPLYLLCRRLKERGKTPTVILGFNTAKEVFYDDKFSALGVKTIVATADGSRGIKGFVTTAMENVEYDYFYTCGPMPMFKAIEKVIKTDGEYSFEERMGCGFGACMGCSVMTKNGAKRICKEGPVLKREEIIW